MTVKTTTGEVDNSVPVEPSIKRDGRVDPRKLDIAAKTPRKRRRRNRPAPAKELRDMESAAEKRAWARPYPPSIILEPADGGGEHWTSPHNDENLWALQLADAFGTRSQAVIVTFMTQLQALCTDRQFEQKTGLWRLDENEFSAAIALVNTIKPRNEMEAALAAQMVAIHLLTMKVTAHAITEYYDNRMVATAGKLARTFAMQMDALRACRTRKPTSRQSIKVRKELHQHVHYHDDRGGKETGGQPHGRAARAADQCAALPSPQPGGEPVPLSCDEGQEPVQAPRR